MKVIRRANTDDWSALWPLLQEMGVRRTQADVLAQFKRILHDRSHLLAVAEDGQKLLGYSWVQNYGPHLRAGFSTARMHDLFVKPEYRKRGVARELLAYIKTWTKEENITYLQWQANRDSAGFYEALGLEAVMDPDLNHPFYEIEFEPS